MTSRRGADRDLKKWLEEQGPIPVTTEQLMKSVKKIRDAINKEVHANDDSESTSDSTSDSTDEDATEKMRMPDTTNLFAKRCILKITPFDVDEYYRKRRRAEQTRTSAPSQTNGESGASFDSARSQLLPRSMQFVPLHQSSWPNSSASTLSQSSSLGNSLSVTQIHAGSSRQVPDGNNFRPKSFLGILKPTGQVHTSQPLINQFVSQSGSKEDHFPIDLNPGAGSVIFQQTGGNEREEVPGKIRVFNVTSLADNDEPRSPPAERVPLAEFKAEPVSEPPEDIAVHASPVKTESATNENHQSSELTASSSQICLKKWLEEQVPIPETTEQLMKSVKKIRIINKEVHANDDSESNSDSTSDSTDEDATEKMRMPDTTKNLFAKRCILKITPFNVDEYYRKDLVVKMKQAKGNRNKTAKPPPSSKASKDCPSSSKSTIRPQTGDHDDEEEPNLAIVNNPPSELPPISDEHALIIPTPRETRHKTAKPPSSSKASKDCPSSSKSLLPLPRTEDVGENRKTKSPRKSNNPRQILSPEQILERREATKKWMQSPPRRMQVPKASAKDFNIRVMKLHKMLNELKQLVQGKPPLVHYKNAQKVDDNEIRRSFELPGCACLVIENAAWLNGWLNPIRHEKMQLSGFDFINTVFEPEMADAEGEDRIVSARFLNQKVCTFIILIVFACLIHL